MTLRTGLKSGGAMSHGLSRPEPERPLSADELAPILGTPAEPIVRLGQDYRERRRLAVRPGHVLHTRPAVSLPRSPISGQRDTRGRLAPRLPARRARGSWRSSRPKTL